MGGRESRGADTLLISFERWKKPEENLGRKLRCLNISRNSRITKQKLPGFDAGEARACVRDGLVVVNYSALSSNDGFSFRRTRRVGLRSSRLLSRVMATSRLEKRKYFHPRRSRSGPAGHTSALRNAKINIYKNPKWNKHVFVRTTGSTLGSEITNGI